MESSQHQDSIFLSRLLIETSGEDLPAVFSLNGVVAFCDLSGFTNLTTQYAKQGPSGMESLGKLLNGYFESLISTLLAHGGDVIAIIGDAALVLFWDGKFKPDGEFDAAPSSPPQGDTAVDASLTVQCTRAIDACQNFLAQSELSVHIGIACGNMHALHLGGFNKRAQFLLVGDPLKHLQSAVCSALPGTICVTPSVHSLLATIPSLPYSLAQTVSGDWILSKSVSHLNLRRRSVWTSATQDPESSSSLHLFPAPPIRQAFSQPEFERQESLISTYLCESVVGRYVGLESTYSSSEIDWLAEWRRLTVIFIKLREFESVESLDQVYHLHQCFIAIEKAVSHHDGSLLHSFNDDKGVIVILAFGMPLKAHDNDPSRAIACALALQTDFIRRGICASMGMSTGHVFCGSLGSSQRKDFTVLGPLVNLAARFMSAAPTDAVCPILCDTATKEAGQASFSFSNPILISAKGFSEPVSAFQPFAAPLSGQVSRRGSQALGTIASAAAGSGGKEWTGGSGATTTMVGREKDMAKLSGAIENWTNGFSPVVLISGDAGMGKSTLTSAALDTLSDAGAPQARTGFGRTTKRTTKKPCAVFHVYCDPLVSSDFHTWASVILMAIEFLMRDGAKSLNAHGFHEMRRSSSHSMMASSHQLPTQTIESCLIGLFSHRFEPLMPFLSLLNPLLNTRFPSSKLCDSLAAKSRSECLFEICHSIIASVLTVAPLVICIEDAHALDPSSWQFATWLAKWCLDHNRMKGGGSGGELHSNPSFNLHAPELASALFSMLSSGDAAAICSQFAPRPRSATSIAASSAARLGAITGGGGSGGANSDPDRSEWGKLTIPSDGPLLMIFNTRMQKKDFRDESGYKSFLNSLRDLKVIELEPLDENALRLLIRNLLPGVSTVTPDVVSLVFHQSQGNALFARELCLSLMQQHMISVTSEGKCCLSLQYAAHNRMNIVGRALPDIPQNIHDVIRSRLDSLPPDQQLLVKVAAVIGTDFDLDVLVSIHPSHISQEQASEQAAHIERLGIFCIGSESDYSFYHRLTQEVSYSLLTPSQKIELHRKLAALIESSLLPPHQSPVIPFSSEAVHTLPGQIAHDSHENLKTGDADDSSGERENFSVLPTLVHHWIYGRVPEKARPRLAKLAERAHDIDNSREAIEWFHMLLDQEVECTEPSPSLVLAKWYRQLGECYYALGEHVSASEWLVRSLTEMGFEVPSSAFGTKVALAKQIAKQYFHRRMRTRPSPPSDEAKAIQQILALKTLLLTRYFLFDTVSSFFYALAGINLSESVRKEVPEASMFYSFVANIMGATSSHKWADRFFEHARKIASTDYDRVWISQGFVAYVVWSCDPRADNEIEESLALTRSIRCWKEVGLLHLIATEHYFQHGLVEQHKDHLSAMLEEARAREDMQLLLGYLLRSAVAALMADDRIAAALLLKRIATECASGQQSNALVPSALPVLACHLLHRDAKWPIATSPHLSAVDCDNFLHLSVLTPTGTTFSDSHAVVPTHFSSLMSFSLASSSTPLVHETNPIVFMQRLLEAGLKAIPTVPLSTAMFHSFHVGLELAILHNVPCHKKLVKRAVKIFQKSSRQFTIFEPISLVWSAFRTLQRDPANSKAFSQLHKAVKLAADRSLPLQQAFAHFSIAHSLCELVKHSKCGVFAPSRIRTISGCDPPFELACDDHLFKADELLFKSGHSFYARLFSSFVDEQ